MQPPRAWRGEGETPYMFISMFSFFPGCSRWAITFREAQIWERTYASTHHPPNSIINSIPIPVPPSVSIQKFKQGKRLELNSPSILDRNWGTSLLRSTASIGDPLHPPWLSPQPLPTPHLFLLPNPSVSQLIRPRNSPSPPTSTTYVVKLSEISRRGSTRQTESCRSSLPCRFVAPKKVSKLSIGEAEMGPKYSIFTALPFFGCLSFPCLRKLVSRCCVWWYTCSAHCIRSQNELHSVGPKMGAFAP